MMAASSGVRVSWVPWPLDLLLLWAGDTRRSVTGEFLGTEVRVPSSKMCSEPRSRRARLRFAAAEPLRSRRGQRKSQIKNFGPGPKPLGFFTLCPPVGSVVRKA